MYQTQGKIEPGEYTQKTREPLLLPGAYELPKGGSYVHSYSLPHTLFSRPSSVVKYSTLGMDLIFFRDTESN